MDMQTTAKGYLQTCRKYKKHHYKELPQEELDYLHETDLKILGEIQRIFEKHRIPYCAVGGTLLGAFTTGHYIPWDEDIDLAVFEEDYDRMIDALIAEIPSSMAVQCTKTDDNYYHEWIKVSDKHSIVHPNNGVYKEQGCWVDIYKLRKLPKNEVAKTIALDHKDYLQRRLAIHDIDEAEYARRMAENRVEARIAEGEQHAKTSPDTAPVYLIGTASKPFVEADYVFPLKEYPFENTKITSFCQAEKYLLNHYGEGFRQLPREEDRYIAINRIERI